MGTLFLAAGGGGDAVAILLARRLLAPDENGPVAIATCAWERLIIDPVPGPRSPDGFTGLREYAAGAFEVLADSDTLPPGRSMLPRLVRESGARVFLLALADGVAGMATQLRAAAGAIGANRIVVVDSGGDAVATGGERSLKSPLADAMGVAGAVATGLPVELVVIGPGADGELSEAEVLTRLDVIGAAKVGQIEAVDVASVEGIFAWHPTEASSIVAAAALGDVATVAMRRGGEPFRISHKTPVVWSVAASLESLPLALAVYGSESLEQAARAIALVASNELDYERAKADQIRRRHRSMRESAELLRGDIRAGATRITLRRARELTGMLDPVGMHSDILITEARGGLLGLSCTARQKPHG